MAALRGINDVPPYLTLDVELPLLPLHIERGERPNLASPKPDVPAQQGDSSDAKVELEGRLDEAAVPREYQNDPPSPSFSDRRLPT